MQLLLVSCPHRWTHDGNLGLGRGLPVPDEVKTLQKGGELLAGYLLRLRHQGTGWNPTQLGVVAQEHKLDASLDRLAQILIQTRWEGNGGRPKRQRRGLLPAHGVI